jgi:Holliday junction resolvasome RuvABC ATP-dependent DNA helicase subunit
MELRKAETEQITEAIVSNQSLLVLGEPGAGKTSLGRQVRQRLEKQGFEVAIANYSGAAKETLTAIAEQLGVSTMTEDDRPKQLTAAQLKESLLKRLSDPQTVLIADDAHRWSASLRYWLEDVVRAGGLLLMLASSPCPAKDVFTKVPRLELAVLRDDEIRSLMKQEAQSYNIALEAKELAELQQRAGNNPALAKRVIREAVLGISEATTGDHHQYIDGTPFLVTLLMLVGVVRFLGLGLGDKVLYVMGGLLTLMALIIRTVLYAANRGGRKL